MKKAAGSWIGLMYYNLVKPHTTNTHTHLYMPLYGHLGWKLCLPTWPQFWFTLLHFHYYYFFTRFLACVRSFSYLLSWLAQVRCLASAPCPRQKTALWPFAVSSSGLGVCAYVHAWMCVSANDHTQKTEWAHLIGTNQQGVLMPWFDLSPAHTCNVAMKGKITQYMNASLLLPWFSSVRWLTLLVPWSWSSCLRYCSRPEWWWWLPPTDPLMVRQSASEHIVLTL